MTAVIIIGNKRSETLWEGDTAGAFLNNSNSQPRSVSCVFCSKQHYSASCTEVTELSKRREILMRDRRYFLCLKKGHRVSECERTTNCRKCSRRHHHSICNTAKPKQEQNTKPREAEPPKSPEHRNSAGTAESPTAASFSVANFTTRTTVVLQTATAQARGTNSSKSEPVRILFDGGSQRSYISKDLRD